VGKSPFIVFDDADLDGAVEGLVDAIWFNQGQVCCAASRCWSRSRFNGHSSDKVRRRMATLRVGDPLDKAIDIGAIVAPSQLERSPAWSKRAGPLGRRVGSRRTRVPSTAGFIRRRWSLASAPRASWPRSRCSGRCSWRCRFERPQRPWRWRTTPRYGLAASVWTQDIDQALDIARGIQAGTILDQLHQLV